MQVVYQVPTPEPGEDPTASLNVEQTAKLNVAGGDPKTLVCSSKVPRVNCVIANNQIDFGVVAVGAEASAEATLTNSGIFGVPVSLHEFFFI